MEKKKLKKWIKILKDKKALNVVFLYLNEWGGFNFVIDDDLLGTIGEEATKKLLEVYNEGFAKSIKQTFEPPKFNIHLRKMTNKSCPNCGKPLKYEHNPSQYHCEECNHYYLPWDIDKDKWTKV